jgi:hypothetical protein
MQSFRPDCEESNRKDCRGAERYRRARRAKAGGPLPGCRSPPAPRYNFKCGRDAGNQLPRRSDRFRVLLYPAAGTIIGARPKADRRCADFKRPLNLCLYQRFRNLREDP